MLLEHPGEVSHVVARGLLLRILANAQILADTGPEERDHEADRHQRMESRGESLNFVESRHRHARRLDYHSIFLP